ncbi:N-acetylmuramoyl-L-alanine amidase [Evansella cellulosilytica]|uniref:Cell wall hydrolase/autolysin n=1 Tax=Evansella cellulosilytica (strain ATCC 21833 / DSM 2522 / FERM P-1141 / JCM 9156 / N-4) TaxID=649639 RepID=E6U1L5_EVAC2|nr:N-acetylmuramoyl-L-alanine amidase [Evansella cellulosilytica]ADU30378.1 cell wall hydrolase/autolysin [Evansella cellulosilytica DSM 2522]
MVRIMIDPGHGGSDPGAVANGLMEKTLVLDIGKRVRKLLEQYEGVEVRMTRTNDTFVSLSDRAKMANEWKADYFASIHVNGGGGEGYEDFIHSNLSNSSQTAKYRDTMHSEIMKQIGGRNRGKKKANFAVLRETAMSAILTENLFIDNSSDAAKLKQSSFLDKIAQGHVNGFVKLFNLKKKPSPKPSKSNGELYKVQVGAFANKSNADRLAAELKSKGYSTYIVKE